RGGDRIQEAAGRGDVEGVRKGCARGRRPERGGGGEGASFYLDARSGLHGDVFCARWYEEGEHKLLIERAKRYLELIESLLQRAAVWQQGQRSEAEKPQSIKV
ncbi:MAG: hypothetical protein QXH81_10520, partial [Thermofilaceae archaeon]